MSALVIDAVVHNGDVHVTEPFYKALRQRFAERTGDGVLLTIRIEPADEVWRQADAKHLYGHLYAPVSKQTGETVADVHLRMKAAHFPDDGRTSLTQLNRDEMRAYIEAVEQDIRENDPGSWDDCVAKIALYEKAQAERQETEREFYIRRSLA